MYELTPKYLSVAPDIVDGTLTVQLKHSENNHVLQTAGGHVVLSESARSIAERFSVCPTVLWSQFRLVAPKQGPMGYFRIKGEQVTIVDRDRSVVDWILERKVIRHVDRWAFLIEPPFDLFYSDASVWLVTDRLAERLIEVLACSLRKCEMV